MRRWSAGFFFLGIFLNELRRPFENALFHDFSSFELHDRAGRDDHFLFGLFGIAADTLLGESGREDAEVSELDAFPFAKASVMPSSVSWITVKISCCVSVDFSEMDRTKSRFVRLAMG